MRGRVDGRLTHEAVDVLDPSFGPWLARELEGAARPAVVAEGLLGYFAPADRVTVARAVAEALGGRGAFVTELRHRSGGGADVAAAVGLLKTGIKLVTRGRGTREDFPSLDAVERYLTEAGFAEAAPIPPVAHLAHLHLPARVWRAA